MQLIRCTGKLQRELGLRKSDLTGVGQPGLLGPWHGNLIYINRRKSLLFVNDRTLFNFIVPDITREVIRGLSSVFTGSLSCVLAEEGFNQKERTSILREYEELGFSSNTDRSVLGSMNDLAFHYTDMILRHGGVHSAAVPTIIQELNRMPMGAIGYDFAVERLKDLYAAAT